MNEGLKKKISLTAMAVSAGMVLGMTSALAADLGGNCCADLEERVAELEATTARKGTRKTSLEVWGLVNQAITGWDDGKRGNATIGYGNHNLQTRFGFRGNAKIGGEYTAGYSIVVDVADKARTSSFGQLQDIGGSKMAGGGATRAGDDYTIRMRDANWWLESSRLGRFTMGRITSEIAVGSPDIAGVLHAVGDDVGCNGGGIGFRNSASATGALSGNTVGTYSSNCGGPWANRLQGIKYQSPTMAGFQLIATYGGNMKLETTNVDSSATNFANAGQELGVGLRYAGEFNGVRLAFNTGVQWDKYDRDLAVVYTNRDAVATTALTSGLLNYSSSDTRLFDLGGAIMHVPTGLFATGNYANLSINAQDPTQPTNSTLLGSRTATRWHIMSGISRNWTGLGNTAFYGEYGRFDNFKYAYNPFSVSATAITLGGAASGDSMTFWGLGMNQKIDAAAMDLYVNFRNFSAKDPTVSLNNVSIVTTGAVIRF
jgi:Gram-negative porin